jgi:acetyl esterase/lipase
MLALDLRDAGGRQPSALALISPVADLTGELASGYRGPDPVLRRSWVSDGARAYLAGADATALSPLQRDLRGLPPLHVQLAGDERLRPEGERLVDALRTAGNDVDSEVLHGLWHDAQVQADLVPGAAAGLRRLGRWISATVDPR